MNKKELEEFRQLILDRRKLVMEELGLFRRERKEDAETLDNKSSTHMADEGSDTIEKERAYLIASKENKYLASLNDALNRLDRGEYGVCIDCGQDISRERLLAVPNTKLCITCKSKMER